ncbi:MAG: HEAT repeat domain-containing protein [Planctomycetes bacterium]|nr:HEAT repeat domain-containing protein [Planctomycetota bacterium]
MAEKPVLPILFTFFVFPLMLNAQAPKSLEKAWYTPAELLTALAERDGIQWALPETLAGRALVGEAATTDALLDDACKQWGLNWTRNHGVLVVHRASDERLKKLTTALEKGDRTAAWELGWLRDGRAVPPLADALASKDVALALAAAQAIEVLDTLVPLGQDERVSVLPTGRVSLAVAFPPKADLASLLGSPHPPIRAAAFRLLLGQGGKAAEDAKARLANDRSDVVHRVRQQMFPTLPTPEKKPVSLLPLPKNPAAIKTACEKIATELPTLAKGSEWEQMRWRVRSLGAWSRANQSAATETLLELTGTKIQFGWFPAFVHMHLAATGSPEAVAKLKDLFPKVERGTISRGLELSLYGNALLAFTRPYLNEQTICYVSTRKAGREAHDDLLAWAGRGEIAAIDALGIIGGAEAVALLRTQLEKDTSDTTIFRSAKSLGRIGSSEALDALLTASESNHRVRRHAATLFISQIGGPKAVARLRELLEKDTDRLVRAAAADGLEQLGDKESQTAVAGFRKADAELPEMIYRPRNPRFGPDFPVNQWVNLKIPIKTDSPFGEMGWNYDASNRLFLRYGGCSGYHNELTVFDLGTEQFVQRRPNEKLAGWGDRRLINGCTAGRCWDPLSKVMWLGPAIGSTDPALAVYDYYNKDGAFRFCNYDLATDRFRAAPKPTYATRYAFDWKNGLLLPVKFTHPNHKTKDFWAFDVKSNTWLDKKTAGDYPRDQDHTTAAVDQDTGLLVVYVTPHPDRPAETRTFDPTRNLWKNMQPKIQPEGVPGGGLVYDPFYKVLLLQSGKKATQFGGGEDSITWIYDVRTNTWTDLNVKTGPGNPWVGAMDYDPEHNVFVLFNHGNRQVWALRYKELAVGAKAK